MKRAEWIRRVAAVLPAHDGWKSVRGTFYREPVSWVLFGVSSDSSSWDDGVYVLRLQMPLFVPHDSVHLSWSPRMENGRRFDRADVGGVAAAIHDASAHDGEAAFLWGLANDGMARDTGGFEESAYALILLGHIDAARSMLSAMSRRDETEVDDREWVTKSRARQRLIASLLDEGGLAAAITQLERWARYAAEHIGVAIELSSPQRDLWPIPRPKTSIQTRAGAWLATRATLMVWRRSDRRNERHWRRYGDAFFGPRPPTQ